jgi:putative ABC transport system permease protein
MFRNYLNAALRNLARNRLYASINIVGLAIAFAAAIFIALFVREELSYDKFIPGHERVYRISMTFATPGDAPNRQEMAIYQVAEALALDFPTIEGVTRLYGNWQSLRAGDIESHEAIGYADANFFVLIPWPVVAGDLRTALDAPDSVVLTRKMARKFFGEDAPLGRTLEVDRKHLLRVTAVIDMPSNTHFSFNLLASSQSPTSPAAFKADAYTYLRLKPGVAPSEVERQLPAFTKRYVPLPPGLQVSLQMMPIAAIHLHPAGAGPQKPPGDAGMLATVAIIGMLIVVIAGVNFVNLMTARATQRAVEVGIRKVAGAGRTDLMWQFIGESILYVAFGMLLAMALVESLMPWFNVLLDGSLGKYEAPAITFEYRGDPSLAAALLGSVLVLGAAAGVYPAFVLSAFRPSAVLKGGPLNAAGSFGVRQTLVVFQFAILVALLLATAVIHRQSEFALNAGLRINRDQVLLIFFRQPGLREKFQRVLAEAPGVEAVTSSQSAPTNFGTSPFIAINEHGTETTLYAAAVDYNFHEFYGLTPLAGRLLSREHGTDALQMVDDKVGPRPLSLVINESAMRQLGHATPRAAIGQRIRTKHWPDAVITIEGVVPDFPVDSLRVPIQPTVYIVDPRALIMISARLSGRAIPETLARIDDLWRRIGEPRAIPRQFLDQYYDYLYTDIRQQGKLFTVASAVAVTIACLGLFGLCVFSAQQRTKEIGIRKAMGASTADIVRLLIWQFTKPVLVASAIALSVGAYLMRRWLEGFAYRIELEPWLVFSSAVAALVIAVATVGIHAYFVARSKPANALRYE